MARYARAGLALLALGIALSTTLTAACGESSRDESAEASGPTGGTTDSSPPTSTIDKGSLDASATDASATALIPAIVTCGALASACAASPSVAGLFATYRKDAYLPEAQYPESGTLPTSGGRLHIAGIASASGDVARVRIDGQTVDDLLTQKAIDWYHVWPATAVAGQPLWVAFHSRAASWDSNKSGTVTVESASGVLLAGTFPVAAAAVPITYVTTTDGGKTLLIHARNADATAHTIARLVVDGKDVTAAACIPKKTLGPGEEALWTVPRCVAEKAGAAWSVVLELTDGPASAGVGRVLPELFPVEAWARSSDCPLPGGNAAALAKHEGAGFDTQYMYFYGGRCGLSGKTLVNTTLPGLAKKLRVLVGDDFLGGPTPETQITDTSAVAGFLTGDESDGEYESNGFPAAELKARSSRRLWSMYPGLPTYNGGKTHKKVGAFAGMADVQGMDFYVAACAPHITPVNSPNPVRGAYDYLRNTRNNHAPLPTWLYAQGLHAGWNKTVLGLTIHVQPDAAEILVQAISVALAGGKGLMWFQTDLDEAALSPERWDAIARANRTFRAVRGWLREGDPAGLASSTPTTLVEGIRARDAIVVPILDLEATKGPNDIECAKVFVGGPVPHFSFATHATEVRVRVPDDFAVDDVFEVVGQAVKDAPSYSIVGRELRFTLTLSQADPVRVLVVANSKSARATAAAGNAP